MAEREMIQPSEVATTTAWLEQRVVSAIVGVVAFVVMITLGAHVRIPLPWTPVPITLQTFFVHLAGATLGPVLGPASLVLYLLVGAAGLPVFAGGGSGLAYLLKGATAGYLIGFMVATAVVGWLVRQRRHPGMLWILFSMAAGSLIIYTCGVSWLAWTFNLSPATAIAKGMLPFLAGDVLKTCAAAGLYRSYRRRVQVVFP
jgi:biotin transport system substrate-specific component